MKSDKLTLYHSKSLNLPIYVASEVDAAIAELKAKLDRAIAERDGNQVCIDALKQKLESVQASMYCDVVDVNMENRRLKEERRWRKFSEEKPSEEMEGEDFLVSNGYYSVVCEWRGYWNNEPFCGDKNCDVVKFWMPLPSAPKEDDK